MRKPLIALSALLVLVLLVVFAFKQTALSPQQKEQEKKQQQASQPVVPQFDKTKLSLTDPNSLWVVASKPRALNPINYAPADLVTPKVALRGSAAFEEMKLRAEAAGALEAMVTGGTAAGVNLKLASGYRSYKTQVSVYNNEVRQYGQKVADTQSARPGHSEHQTGLAADLQDAAGRCVVADCFKDLSEGKWVAEHAWEYGFIVRYTPGKEVITGYRYEPWHLRYVGKELAAELHKTSVQTLEEFFGIVEKLPY